jgi:hypothetical protein
MKAFIYFPGDPSVGIFPETLECDLPFPHFADMDEPKERREECRKEIEKFYTSWCDERCQVSFSDENEMDPEARSKFEDATIEGMQPDFSSDDWEADQLWAERPTPYDP